MKQPKAFYLLTFVQMCKFFSNFGMRALLVLYMVNALHLSDGRVFGINAVFLGILELSAIFGGILADKVLGLRRATCFGALFLMLGYLGLIFKGAMFVALTLIVVGGSLYAGNIAALIGAAYQENDPRREKGFTLFYMIQNVGALASTFLCGLIADRYGYQAGFAFAASGMVIGFFAFLLGGRLLKGLEGRPAQRIPIWWIPILGVIFVFSFFAMKFEDIALPCLPWATATVFIFFSYKLLKSQEIPKEKSRLLLLYLVGMILFFAVEDQICSSLVIFAERVSQRSIGGWAIPSSILITINPMVILLFGALIAKVRFPLSIPFFLAAFAFGLLAFFCFKHLPFSIFTMMGIVSLISIAELMVGPVIYSYASEVAAKGKAGTVMGMLPVAFSLAFLLSGKFSKMVAIDETQSTFFIYGTGFAKIALIVLLGGVVLELLKKRFTNAKRPVY